MQEADHFIARVHVDVQGPSAAASRREAVLILPLPPVPQRAGSDTQLTGDVAAAGFSLRCPIGVIDGPAANLAFVDTPRPLAMRVQSPAAWPACRPAWPARWGGQAASVCRRRNGDLQRPPGLASRRLMATG
jgi:hypothetical protein